MLSDRQLSRITANRQPTVFARRLGSLLQPVIEQQRAATAERVAIQSHLEAVTDFGFQSRCKMGPIRDGVLTILVDDRRWVQPMREQWLFALLERLEKCCPRPRIRRIEFRAGGGSPSA